MEGLQQKHRPSNLIIGMEPTGHYWWNLANWLADKSMSVVLVNPATTKRNKENRDNCPSKSDPKDALAEIPMAAQLRSIKGLGPIFIAAILSGAGDLRQYAHGRQLLRKAGLNLAESMSGKRKGQVLSKRGNSTLRKYVYLATIRSDNNESCLLTTASA